MNEKTIHVGGSFEATVTAESVKFNKPVTILGMAYVEAIREAVEEIKSNTPLKPHKDYDFVNNDKVFVENSDETVDYFQLSYEPELSEWIVIPYTDKHFTEPKKNEKGRVVAEPMNAYGYDLLQRVEDYDFDELD